MAATIVEHADFEIKSGNAFCTFHSFDGTSEIVVFPIANFRAAMGQARGALAEFDLDVKVANIAGARSVAARKGAR